MARIVVPGAPHHVTQRGNRRQPTFFEDADYLLYLHLAREAFSRAEVEVWAYCLMPNHVHLIAAPGDEQGLAAAVGATHLAYTRHVNRRQRWTGYLWQGRFASFPMDGEHLRQAVRYVGLNPVRAGLCARAADWPWSSVGAHLGRRANPLLTAAPVTTLLAADPRLFDLDVEAEGLRRLRAASSSGRPLGGAAWVKALEAASGRILLPCPAGRPRRDTSPEAAARAPAL